MTLPRTIAALAPLTALIASLLLITLPAQADTLVIPLGQQAGQAAVTLPQRGMSTTSVTQQHGEPVRRHGAVGDPPISRWDYADFSVYFEHGKVVHSVRQHRRQGN